MNPTDPLPAHSLPGPTRVTRRHFVGRSAGAVAAWTGFSVAADAGDPSALASRPTDEALEVRLPGGTEILRYHRRPPAGTPIASAGFFHPLATPAGVVVTDLSPDDHPHHRGVFLGWVEMHGAKDADFWGWGAHAPVRDRRIRGEWLRQARIGGPVVQFAARNRWEAEDTLVLTEDLAARFRVEGETSILDLEYQLQPAADLTLARWAFSGFCLRLRKDGKGTLHAPSGPVTLADPVHTRPETDAPDAPWYAFALELPDGRKCGGAVLNHPANPPTLWHNPRSIRMLNPCVVAPGSLTWKGGTQVRLRYRVVAFDGELPAARLNALAAEWAGRPGRE